MKSRHYIEFQSRQPYSESELDDWCHANLEEKYVVVVSKDFWDEEGTDIRGWFRDADDAVLFKMRFL